MCKSTCSFFLLVLLSCSQPIDRSKVGKIKTVLILGNSIVRHAPKPDIGWTGDWGMAASSMDSDFVHILMRAMHAKDATVKIRFANIADFERSYATYNLSNLDSLKNPDMLIMKISENVNDSAAGFAEYYGKLINYIDPGHKAVKVIVDGFWDKRGPNEAIEGYAKEGKLPYIKLHDLSNNAVNMATAFSNPGVAAHPSNVGMKAIAARIWGYIDAYF